MLQRSTPTKPPLNGIILRIAINVTMMTTSILAFASTVTTFSPPLTRTITPLIRHHLPLTTTRLYSSTPPTPSSPSGYSARSVNWYPGHIAKAEKMLSESLKAVDVVIEVRDARAPKATAHPRVGEWSAGRPRIVVLTKSDLVPRQSVSRWLKSYQVFGAGRWDAVVDGDVKNKAMQAWKERRRFNNFSGEEGSHPSPSSSQQQRPSPRNSITSAVEDVIFIDAKRGQGIHSLNRAILKAGKHINERRSRRGLSDRALRVGVIGYPNVGKSALINKILGRKRARSYDTPGVTRSLQWMRVRADGSASASGGYNHRKEFELLDSPGIIPANIGDQSDALLVAACNSIGQASYDNQAVAAYLMEWLKTLYLMGRGDVTAPKWRESCVERYKFDPMEEVMVKDLASEKLKFHEDGDKTSRLLTGDEMLYVVADNTCQSDPEDASRKILQDFRNGRLGPIALQLAPESDDDDGHKAIRIQNNVAAVLGDMGDDGMLSWEEEQRRQVKEERERRAAMAMDEAEKQGLELPPVVYETRNEEDEDGEGKKGDGGGVTKEDVGKGLFDGW